MTEPNTHDQRIRGVLSRLEAVIDAENAALGVEPNYDLSRSNGAKSRCLYDMTMLFRDVSPAQLGPAHQNQLRIVRRKLDANNIRVKAHMEAVRDIAEMIKETVAASETDGTYSMDQFRGYDLS